MICYQKKKKCGNKYLEHCGCIKGTEIHDTSIVELLTDISARVVTEEMNQALVAPFEKAEVDIALSQMEALKSPGPDGMPPLFFQHI